jgi:hypothetical protein
MSDIWMSALNIVALCAMANLVFGFSKTTLQYLTLKKASRLVFIKVDWYCRQDTPHLSYFLIYALFQYGPALHVS